MGRDLQVLPTLPNVNQLFLKAVTTLRRPGPEKGLPDRGVLVMELQQDVARAAEYARVCSFSVKQQVPATWLHVLTFPLQAQLMSQPDFPFALPGLVHVSNSMTLHRPVGVEERLRLAVEAVNLQPHKRGVTFDLVGRIHSGDELVWEGHSNYLAAKAKLPGEPPAVERLQLPETVPSQKWKLGPDLGRRYAAVSGDNNPIHLSPVTARLFGFPRPIIHGMWTHARALAAFGGALPDAYRVDLQFTKPILLPTTVFFAADTEGRFSVLGKDDKPRLVGAVTPLTS